jgi:hypothetical protein
MKTIAELVSIAWIKGGGNIAGDILAQRMSRWQAKNGPLARDRSNFRYAPGYLGCSPAEACFQKLQRRLSNTQIVAANFPMVEDGFPPGWKFSIQLG